MGKEKERYIYKQQQCENQANTHNHNNTAEKTEKIGRRPVERRKSNKIYTSLLRDNVRVA